MAKECLWYNGQTASYELLDLEPTNLTEKQIKKKAAEVLQAKYDFDND